VLYADSGILVILKATLWFVLWVCALQGLGGVVVRGFFGTSRGALVFLHKVFSISIGLFLVSVWTFIVGSFGYLNLQAVCTPLILGLLLFLKDQTSLKREGNVWYRFFTEMDTIDWVVFVGFSVLALVSFIGAQAPAIGNDSLAYHLYFPKLYVQAGRIFYDPTHSRSLWPYMMEMLFSVGLLCQGVALAKLFSWLTAYLSVFAVPCFLFALYSSEKIARIGLVLMMLIPAIWMQSIYAYVDNAMMLYTLLSFIALWYWQKRGYRKQDAFISGMFLAALLSIKFFTLIPLFLLGIIFLYLMAKSPVSISKKLGGVGIMVAVCFVFSGFWFVRSWIYTGNPVFPFLHQLFGEGFNHHAVGFSQISKSLLNLLMIPGLVPIRPDLFGGEPIGILFLVALPLLFLKRQHSIYNVMLFFVTAYIGIWFFATQQVRFLFPIFPFLSLIFATQISEWLSGQTPLQYRFRFVIFVLVGMHALLSLYYPLRVVKVALGLTDADTYLSQNERTYLPLREMKEKLSPTDKILFLREARLFYAPVPVVFYSPEMLELKRKSGEALSTWLRNQSITHMMMSTKNSGEGHPYDVLSDIQEQGFNLSKVYSKEIIFEGNRVNHSLWKIVQ